MAKVNRKYNKGGALKSVPSKNKGLKKLPTSVRNKMGYMKGGGKSVKVNKKYEDGGTIYSSYDRAMAFADTWAQSSGGGGTKTYRYYDENGNVKSFNITHKTQVEKDIAKAKSQTQQQERNEEADDQYLKNLQDAYSSPDEESEREYKHGGKIKKGKKDEMAIIIAIGRPKANKKSGPKAPIRAKKKKYDNGGIPIPEDTGTDSTVYNSEREAEAAAQKWASDGLPLKGGKCSMRFGYREVVDGVAKKIKYVTYTKDECAEGIIKESQKKKERETAREEWEQSPEGQKSLDKNQASFVRMINEAYEESKRNQ
jgi:hypothetical protein